MCDSISINFLNKWERERKRKRKCSRKRQRFTEICKLSLELKFTESLLIVFYLWSSWPIKTSVFGGLILAGSNKLKRAEREREMARWYIRGFASRQVVFDASLVNFIHWNIISWLATGTQRCEAINVLLHRDCIVLLISISTLMLESSSILHFVSFRNAAILHSF